MRNFIALACGALAGAGLMISGMTDTTVIPGFLDIPGAWHPTLAFVLGAAVLPMMVAWRIVARRSAPVLGAAFPEFATDRLDRRLIIGSSIYGIGWGLAGLCPGPALASITFGGTGGLVFMGAMLAGMFVAPPLSTRLEVAA